MAEAFCDKLDFVLESLQQSQEYYRDYFLRHGGGENG